VFGLLAKRQEIGLAISKHPAFSKIHNSLARVSEVQTVLEVEHKTPGAINQEEEEAFHFISFVPFKGKVYEMDGCRPSPIAVGTYTNEQKWYTNTLDVIQGRMTSQEHFFNLIGITPDPILELSTTLESMFDLHGSGDEELRLMLAEEIKSTMIQLENEINIIKREEAELAEKRFNYGPFIRKYLTIAHDKGFV
jgi:ubiquitin carboxyl-terminal hydrolase L5